MEHQVYAQSIAKAVHYRYITETYEYECYTQKHCGKHAQLVLEQLIISHYSRPESMIKII